MGGSHGGGAGQACYVFWLPLSCGDALPLASARGLTEGLVRIVPTLSGLLAPPVLVSLGVEGFFLSPWASVAQAAPTLEQRDLEGELGGQELAREGEAAAGVLDSGESWRSDLGSLLFGLGESALSLEPGMLSLTGPSTLLATVASCDTTLSIPLSGVEGDGVETAAAAPPIMACLRLSASFFSLLIPAPAPPPVEEEGKGV